METQDQTVDGSATALKELLVNFVGNKINPENDAVTIEHIANVFADEFPEFLIVLAEENWINGYTQALSDSDFVNKQMKKSRNNESEESNTK
jgi:hypothetical protein